MAQVSQGWIKTSVQNASFKSLGGEVFSTEWTDLIKTCQNMCSRPSIHSCYLKTCENIAMCCRCLTCSTGSCSILDIFWLSPNPWICGPHRISTENASLWKTITTWHGWTNAWSIIFLAWGSRRHVTTPWKLRIPWKPNSVLIRHWRAHQTTAIPSRTPVLQSCD